MLDVLREALALVIGPEAILAARDVCGLSAARTREVTRWATEALVAHARDPNPTRRGGRGRSVAYELEDWRSVTGVDRWSGPDQLDLAALLSTIIDPPTPRRHHRHDACGAPEVRRHAAMERASSSPPSCLDIREKFEPV